MSVADLINDRLLLVLEKEITYISIIEANN